MTVIKKSTVWICYLLGLLALPQFFDSVLAISIFNQMAIAIVFALSYNMLLGQGGMLSFGHAVYFGLGGFLAVHALVMIEFEILSFSIIWIPLVGGFIGLLAALFIGTFSTHKAPNCEYRPGLLLWLPIEIQERGGKTSAICVNADGK